jgi:hypothetical protein
MTLAAVGDVEQLLALLVLPYSLEPQACSFGFWHQPGAKLFAHRAKSWLEDGSESETDRTEQERCGSSNPGAKHSVSRHVNGTRAAA